MDERKNAVNIPPDMLLIPSEALFAIVEEYLGNGQDVIIRVRGNSMYPLTRNNIDSVKLRAAAFGQIKKRDIVLIRRDNGAYILHRVYKKTPHLFYMIGDNQQEIEGPLRPEQLLAVVEEVYRGDVVIRRGSPIWNIYAGVWLILRPVRTPVLAALVRLRGMTKRGRKKL